MKFLMFILAEILCLARSIDTFTVEPTMAPSMAPSMTPSMTHSMTHSMTPTMVPTCVPSATLSSLNPTLNPTIIPTVPSGVPTSLSNAFPTVLTIIPSEVPSPISSVSPSVTSTAIPTVSPSVLSSGTPINPSVTPTMTPSAAPTVKPSNNPSFLRTSDPVVQPTVVPTFAPSVEPIGPSVRPSLIPTIGSSRKPTVKPSVVSSVRPTIIPTNAPSEAPTEAPTEAPSAVVPSKKPSNRPTLRPSARPTIKATPAPTRKPTVFPTVSPTATPTEKPTEESAASPTGMIVGIVIGCLTLLVIGGAFAWCYYFKKKEKTAKKNTELTIRSAHRPHSHLENPIGDIETATKNAEIIIRSTCRPHCPMENQFGHIECPKMPDTAISEPPMMSLDIEHFRYRDKKYRISNMAAVQLTNANLNHLKITEGRAVSITSTLPLLNEIARQYSAISNNAEMMAFFPCNFSSILCRAVAVRCVVRLMDSYVRSSILFCQDGAYLARLFPQKHPVRSTMDMLSRRMLREFIDDNWTVLFSEVIDDPHNALQLSVSMPLVKKVLLELHCADLNIDWVFEFINRFIQGCPSVIPILFKLVLVVALSQEGLQIAQLPVVLNDYDKRVHDCIGEAGQGFESEVLIILPHLVQGENCKGKSIVYKRQKTPSVRRKIKH